MQIVSDLSPPHPEITNTPNNLTIECEQGFKETSNDTLIDLLDTSSYRDEIVPKKFHPNTTLVPHNSTWFTNFVEYLWKEQRKSKRNNEKDNGSITL